MKTNNFNLFKILGSLMMCMIIGVSMMVSTTNQAEAARIKAVNAARIAVSIARNNKNGYNQRRRARRNGIGGYEYDCSSFVYTVYKKAGVGVGLGCSSTIRRDFKRKGFTYMSRSKVGMGSSRNLKTGDVLVAHGHVELYAGGGKMVGAHRNYDGRAGDSTGKEISVKRYSSSRWYGILRYTRGASTTTARAKCTTSTVSKKTDNDSKSSTTVASKTKKTAADKSKKKTTKKSTKKTKTAKKTQKKTKTTKKTTRKVTPKKTVQKKKTTQKSSSKYSTGTWRTKMSMNVRRGPGLNYGTVGAVKKGALVKVTAVSGRFGKISYKGKTAWVSLKYSAKVK